MTFTFIDLFAGIGGTRQAFEIAGGRCVFSCENDKFARLTYKENFEDTPSGDIMLVREEDIPNHDILVAGFPCQPFSLSGVSKRKSLGQPHGFECKTKGHLFFKIVKILATKYPIAFFLENVKHLKYHDKGRTFKAVLNQLEQVGYDVFFKVIDASCVVPQHRERLYIVGFRKNLNAEFFFPHFLDLKPKLERLLESQVDTKYTLSDKLWEYLQKYREEQRKKGNGFGYGLVDPDGVSRTLSARYYKDGAEILIPQDEKNPRRLTPRECARLMGFPNNFKIPVSDTQAYKQFGNSVVIPIIEKIAWRIVECWQMHNYQSCNTYPLELSKKYRNN